MKIAICISGQPRNYKESFNSLDEHFLKKYDCDVYFHSWKASTFESTNFGTGNKKYQLSEEQYEELLELYRPKSFIYEEPVVFDASGYKCPIWRQPLNNTLSMFYSIHKACQLVEGNYDYIVRARFDLDYSKFNLDLPQYGIAIPKWNTDPRVSSRGYYDVFAVGKPAEMLVYSQVFCNAISYITNDSQILEHLQGGWPGQDSPLRNEYLLKWHLLKNSIDVRVLETLEDKSDAGLIR
tara:strand:- start:1151 stop:1864 length:714 start_codon:yes stop_codon:yes gene_type:complete